MNCDILAHAGRLDLADITGLGGGNTHHQYKASFTQRKQRAYRLIAQQERKNRRRHVSFGCAFFSFSLGTGSFHFRSEGGHVDQHYSSEHLFWELKNEMQTSLDEMIEHAEELLSLNDGLPLFGGTE